MDWIKAILGMFNCSPNKEEEYSLLEDFASTAEVEWQRGIKEEYGVVNHDITAMFDQNKWGSWLRHPEGGNCPDGYVRPPDPDWCGHAIANHALKMKKPVNETLCQKVFPSTYRLNSLNHWGKAGYNEIPRIEDHSQLRRGDIVVLRWEGGRSYGDHIVLAISDLKEDGTFETIEGNAKGRLPSGTGRGLVKQTRNKEQVARIYRLTEKHLQ